LVSHWQQLLAPEEPEEGNLHVRLCVQRRLACSVGGKPTRGKARAL
jgi:hypothetical protein